MSGATAPTRSVGAEFQAKLTAEGEFVKIPGLMELGQIGSEGSFIATTGLDELEPAAILDRDPQNELSHTFKSMPGDATQSSFIALCGVNTPIPCKVVYTSGEVRTFSAIYSKPFHQAPAEGSLNLFGIAGRAQGAIVRTVASS